MKRIFLTISFFTLSNLSIGQVAGFKISNKISKFDDIEKTNIVTPKGINKPVYKTPEIIEYNYNKQILDSKVLELTNSTDDLYNNSIGSQADRYSDSIIKSKSDKITLLKEEIASIRKKQESLYNVYIKDFLLSKKVNVFNFGSIRSRVFFNYVYGNSTKRFKTLSNSGFNIGNNTGSVFSELVSGNLGLFRVSLGSMVSKNANSDSTKSKNEEAYQRLISYGGNTVLNFEYPLAYIHSNNHQYNLISRLVGKGTADFPAFGTTTEKWAGSASIGFDIYADASLDNDALRFFLNFNVKKIYGTDVFIDNLGIKNNNFNLGQFSLGLIVLENIKLSFMISTFGSEKSLNNKNVVIGGQILN